MTTDFAGDRDNFPALVTAPSDGEPRDGNSVQVPFEQLADRTANVQHQIARMAAANWIPGRIASTGATPGDLKGIASDGRNWVAVGEDDGTRAQVFYSIGTSQFTQAMSVGGGSFDLFDIDYDSNGDVFVAVGEADGSDALIVTQTTPSTALEVWGVQSNPKNFDLNVVRAAASGAIVAAGEHDGSDMYAVRSTNAGVTWAEIAVAGSASDVINDIDVQGTTFIIVGETAGGGPLMWRSSDDGATFSAVTLPGGANEELRAITYDGTNWLAFGRDGQTLRSTNDGVTWSVLTGPTLNPGFLQAKNAKADPSTGIIQVSSAASAQGIQMSDDGGDTWVRVPFPASSGATVHFDFMGFRDGVWASAHINVGLDEIVGARTLGNP